MKVIAALLVISLFTIVSSAAVMAHCPLCTVAVGAAAISAEMYGVDPSIVGIFIGAFGISTGIWIARKIKHHFPFQTSLIVLASFLLTVIPLYKINSDYLYIPLLLAGSAGSILNKVYWLNKILVGSVLGGIVSLFAYGIHVFIKKINGKVLFPFQGIVITIISLLLLSIPMYFWMK